ncbi:crosslink repair DNA glycosylase YcaQ family protein [Promicromonospora sp. Populi]|uniref:DNA glycosylase AlkZ-like family protein n=1 Tax=Promicromonospora sp. Populi TaxID=3239420 RepID=UPI0034E2425D
MANHRLTVLQARRIALRAQLLDARRPVDLVQLVEDLTFLAVDPTAAVAPAVDLVAWSRLGNEYWQGAVDDAITDRMLFQLRGTVRSMGDLPLYLEQMSRWPQNKTMRQWLADNADFEREVLAQVAAEGPVLAKDVPDGARVPYTWGAEGWSSRRSVAEMLEALNMQGKLAMVGRKGRQRLWDLAERVYPQVEAVPLEQALQERVDRRLAAEGIARKRVQGRSGDEVWWVDLPGEAVEIEGVDGEWRVDPEQLERVDDEFEPRTALLSPFDAMAADRPRLLDLFDFEYTLEMYKPKGKRRWGYFALPILHGERFVGKLDAKADHKAGVLNVFAVHEDLPFAGPTMDAVHAEIEQLAAWLGLSRVDYARDA